jgi:hypothetical protein
MSDEKELHEETAKPYEPPKIIRVSLRPEEAVLGHCKISGGSGPVSGTCLSMTCKVVGS